MLGLRRNLQCDRDDLNSVLDSKSDHRPYPHTVGILAHLAGYRNDPNRLSPSGWDRKAQKELIRWRRPASDEGSFFWFGRLAIEMGFVVAYDRNQPCD